MTSEAAYSAEALEGVSIIAGNLSVGRFQYVPPVKAAIDAGLAYDSDPTYWASDMNIGRSAALTDEGLRVAHEHGLFVPCGCGTCRWEANPKVSAYCPSCRVRGNREGWINGTQCYGCYLTAHPDVFAARSAILEANKNYRTSRGKQPIGVRRLSADERDAWLLEQYRMQSRYNEGLSYIDPGHTRVKDFR